MKVISNGSKNLKSSKEDKVISIALMAPIVILSVQYLILIYFNLIETETGSRVQLISKAMVSITFLYAFLPVLKRVKIKFIGIYGLSVFGFLIHYVFFPENREYIIGLLFPYFFMSLPAFIYALSIRNFKAFSDVMKKSSHIVFGIGLFIGVLVFLDKSSIGDYSMSLSYYMLLPTILFLNDLIDRFSFKMLLLTGLSLFIILLLGARGPILGIIVFSILKFIRPSSKRSYKSILAYVSFIGVATISLIMYKKILMALYIFFQGFGINSRTLYLFLREDIHLSGREKIYEIVLEGIMGSPVFGVGIAGDRRILDGAYTHNLFLEIISNFGIVFGTIASFSLIIIIIKSLITKSKCNYNLIIVWISLGFVHLMVSSSYLIDFQFWVFLGILLNKTGGFYNAEVAQYRCSSEK